MNNGHTRLSIDSRSVIKVIAILAVAFMVFLVRDILLVILTAIVIASAIEPGARLSKKLHLPRTLVVLGIYVLTALLFLGTLYFLLVPLLSESASFLSSIPEYTESFAAATTTPAFFGSQFIQGITSTVSLPNLIEQINGAIVHISSGVFGTIDVIFGGVLSFVLIIVLSFYLAVQEDGITKFLRIITPASKEKHIISIWRRSQEKIGLWMQGQLLLAVIVGVLTFLGLTLLGVPNALLLAFITGMLEIIPLFGPILAAVPAVIISFASGGFGLAALVTALFVIIQQFESHLIYPLVVRKVVGVPPIISIIALVIGAKLAGFLGILLAVPLATVIMVLLEDMEKAKHAPAVE